MSETRKTEPEKVGSELILTIRDNLEMSLRNATTLDQVLRETDAAKRKVVVESRSSSYDLGGFFIDEESSPGYRGHMFVGHQGGDALYGTVTGLVGRTDGERKKLQIEINLGSESEPIPCFFQFDETLEGCIISRG